jgi:hypothetical protein
MSNVRMWLLSGDADWEAIAFCVRGRLINHEEVPGDVWTEMRIFRDEDHIVVWHQSGEVEVYVRKDPPAYSLWLVREEQRLAEETYGID